MSEMKKHRSFSWSQLSGELKRRHVYTVVATYALVSWVLLQIGEVTFGPLHLPEWVMSRLVVLVIIGFPIVVVLAWFFDLTREGIRLTPNLTLHSEEESDRPSIAVLPFADMSPERDQGYFCEGVAEEILNALSNIPQLRVAPRSPSFEYRDSRGDLRRIGRELGVKSVL
jgi:adenylate cyclase